MDENPVIEALKSVIRIILIIALMLIIIWGLHKIYLKYTEKVPPNPENNCEDQNDCEEDNPQEPEGIQVNTIPVELSTKDYSNLESNFSKTGQLVADQEVKVFPEISGLIDNINIQEGSYVKAGDTLLNLKDSTQLDQAVANYNSALAQLSNAQKTLQVTNQSGQITQSTYQNQIQSAQNNIQSAILNLESTQSLRYQQYRLEDSQSLQKSQNTKLEEINANTTETVTQTDNPEKEQLQADIKENQNFNIIQSRYLQEQQGYVQDQQNSIKVNDAYNQLNLLSKQLESSKAQSDLQALNVNNQILQIQSQLELAKISLEAGEITSPIEGIVTRIHVSPGEKVSQQTPLFTITDFNSLIAETYLSPEEVIQLNQDTRVEVTIMNQTVSAQIISVALTADPISKTILVKIKPDLNESTPAIPNTFTSINFIPATQTPTGDPNAFTISTKYLHFKPEGIFVAIAENNKVIHKKVDLNLPIKNGQTAIKSGVNNNDLIITYPLGLAPGTTIKTD